MVSRILVPIDGSPQSTTILPYVERLATPGHTEIILLQVADEPTEWALPQPQRLTDRFAPRGTPPTPEDYADRYVRLEEAMAEASAQARASLHVAEARLTSQGFFVRTIVRFGSPVQEIVACAHQERVDLVALSAHGWSGFTQSMFGSVAEQVVKNLQIPVLILRSTEVEDY